MMNVAIIKYQKSTNETLVYTSDSRLFSFPGKPLSLLEKLCIMNGSTLEGRIQAFKHSMNLYKKCPIYVHECLMLFVTCAKENEDCLFINYHDLFQYHSYENNKTYLKFIKGYTVVIDFDYRIINKQVKRCREYIDILLSNKKILYDELSNTKGFFIDE